MSAATRRPVGDELFGGRLKDAFFLDLEVVATTDHTARLRTITFRSTDLIGFAWQPGQDVMFTVPSEPPARRRYSIRRLDTEAGTLDIDVVLHGDGLFATWARAAAAGDRIEGIGPRGVIGVRDGAPQHVFVADESAIGATFAMIEAVPAGVTATALMVSDDGAAALEHPSTAADLDLRWLSTAELENELREVELVERAVAYINGERSLVRDTAKVLAERGLGSEDVFTKAYWRRDQPNAAHGEPSKD